MKTPALILTELPIQRNPLNFIYFTMIVKRLELYDKENCIWIKINKIRVPQIAVI
jgi:hypothetical protein